MSRLCCCNHDGEGDVPQSIFVPLRSRSRHKLVDVVEMSEVDRLVGMGLLSVCEAEPLQIYKGRVVALHCMDPSVSFYKQLLMSYIGDVAPYVRPGCGLLFDPSGEAFQERLGFIRSFLIKTMLNSGVDVSVFKKMDRDVNELRKFIYGVPGRHFGGFLAILFGAHFPCGAAGGMSLEEVCYAVIFGSRYLKLFFPDIDMLLSIFISARIVMGEHIPYQNVLMWMKINPDYDIPGQ